MDILIKGATIVTQNERREIIDGDILVKGGRIAEIGDFTGAKAALEIDASDKIAIPGFVNAHSHVATTIFRGYGEELPLAERIAKSIVPVEVKETPWDARVAAKVAFCEMLHSGITCFSETCVTGSKRIREAALEAGMRGEVAHGLMDRVPGRSTESELRFMKKTIFARNGLVKPAIGPYSPATCSDRLITEAKEFAGENGLNFHMQVGETRREALETLKMAGKAPIEHLDSLGAVDGRSLFVHGTWVTKKEIALAGRKRLNIGHCPVADMKLGTGGTCPVLEYDAAGANVALATNSVIGSGSFNMFECMKLASLLQKHATWKAEALPPQKALDMATRNGAKATGWDCGSLEKGKLADIVLLRRGSNMRPEHDIVANIVYSAGPCNVSDVIIGGRLVMEAGEIKTVDERLAMDKAQEAAEDIRKR